MELLLVPVPLLNQKKEVEAYLLRYRLTSPDNIPAADLEPPLLKALETGGVEAFAGGNVIFVPVVQEMLAKMADEFAQNPQITTILLESLDTPVTMQSLWWLRMLKEKGYTLAVIHRDDMIHADDLLNMCSYVVFDREAMASAKCREYVTHYKNTYRHLQVVASGLDHQEAYQKAMEDGFQLFEGMFYRVPANEKIKELSPSKANLIRLLNLVRDENFEFVSVVEVVRGDPALSYSLMRFINSPYLGFKNKVKSIQHAVTMLGQIEVRKWVTAAVFKALSADRPSELTRLSLVRAKFAEDLAGQFGLQEEAGSLFLMGLFSLLDMMLETTMEDALSRLNVSDDIVQALIHQKGRYCDAMTFVLDYERADWVSVVEKCKAYGFTVPEVYQAYLDAVCWYHELLAVRAPSVNQEQMRKPRTSTRMF